MICCYIYSKNTISNYKINEYESSSFIYHNSYAEFVCFSACSMQPKGTTSSSSSTAMSSGPSASDWKGAVKGT